MMLSAFGRRGGKLLWRDIELVSSLSRKNDSCKYTSVLVSLIVLRSISTGRILPRSARFALLSSKNIGIRAYSSPAEKHEFQAETKSLLDIVAKSLYSEQEAGYFSILLLWFQT